MVTTWSCPSSSASRVCSMKAATSEPTKFSPSPRPTTSGELRRAATTRDGSSASTATRVNAPCSRAQTATMASVRLSHRISSDSSRWAAISVSVSESSSSPAASTSARSSAKFSMMPLCTSATRPWLPRWGWALTSLGAPCVAHRVCPMPVVDSGSGELRERLLEVGELAGLLGPGDRCRRRPERRRPSRSRGTPGDGAPRSRRPGPACRPTYPTMPHMAASLSAGCAPSGAGDAACNNPAHVHGGVQGGQRRRALAVRRARPQRVGGPRRAGDAAAVRRGDQPAARARRPARPRRGGAGLPPSVAAPQPAGAGRPPAAPQAGGVPAPPAAPAHAVRDRAGRLGGGGQVDDRPRARADAGALGRAPQRRAGDHRRLPLPQRRARAPRHPAAQGLPRVLRPARAAAVRRRHQVRQGRGRGPDLLPPRLRRGARRPGRGAPPRHRDHRGPQRPPAGTDHARTAAPGWR